MKLTFAGPLISTFVKNDFDILSRHFEVDAINVNVGKGLTAVWNLTKLHSRIIRSIARREVLFFWFADYYTWIPTRVAKLLGKKVFVVAGGFDVTYIPELGIGARAKPARWLAVKNTFRSCDHILPVSQDTQNDLDSAVPDHAPSTMIYNAVDTQKYHYRESNRSTVLTVSQADSLPEYKRKGIDKFIQLAKYFPEVNFRVVGVRGVVAEEAAREASGIDNVTVVPGRVPLDALLEEFWQAKVYCQLSLEERFGVSVAEAMSCGCIPVVTPVNALKEVVGDCGIIAAGYDPMEARVAMQRALILDSGAARFASETAKRFDISERERQLLIVLGRYIPSPQSTQ